MIPIANDDGKKMEERDEAERFIDEYTRITGVPCTLVAVGERPDFLCKKWGRRFGLELVRAMRHPAQHHWDVSLEDDELLHGLDAALLVQETVLVKDNKRKSDGWCFPKSTILVIQMIGSDGDSLLNYLSEQLMDEMYESGFREIWIADYSPMEAYGEIQLIGIKPKRWRGLHRHVFHETKPYG